MKTQQFKTNVKCGACVQAITPEMAKLEADSWAVDLQDKDRVLTVTGDLDQDSILEALKKSGYQGEPI
ncbi:hypothetical protein P872_17685 [Rhodonellum psychrophilum GCM71 = DSM 17998]|uniref:HMA domain-containing protein n=2 Tax=Rhodonellum TaxID=336827 RepID=U5BX77_9BACT|nr:MULTISPECIES: heavy-metal-associated domain-containing protein [Rhodonellum]ERM82458.1 hypothetical protein P872_17685 [Rhodonellum psychrophilum GCM71 = DSM 17998]MDO9553689.1 heavy-metal-associated domain-containing protein [Rhodonellum sp.]SDY69330.1 Copper chaperone CopZ [Rhodonellum ikkaensis]